MGTSIEHGTLLDQKSAKQSIGHCESKHLKLWFDEECSKLVDRRKQIKVEWFLGPREGNEDNFSNVRREASRHFETRKGNI
jgi:hypothetical protein